MSHNAVKLTAAFKDYLWGGSKLKSIYNKKNDLDIVAESWELSAHKDGESVIADSGLKFSEYIKNTELGTRCERFDYFPILIKFIDACGDLSVQVHPDDKYALKNEGEYGKTEMWYILDCEEGACLYYGFNRDVTRAEYKAAVEQGRLTELLNRVNVRKGDVFFIPAGTVHAIGAGIIICEIQQNSNTTYRVYDYNRRDKDGNLRPLHIEKALEVSSLEKAPKLTPTPDGEDVMLASCEYFTVRRLRVEGEKEIKITKESFHSVIVTEGQGVLDLNGKQMTFCKGDSIFIPAQEADYTVNGKCELILSYV